MKSIQLRINITSIRSRNDGSLGMSLETPELSITEKVAIMSLQGIECEAVITPIDIANDLMVIEKTLDNKSPSERLRDVLFVLFKQVNSNELFDVYYKRKMEQIIDSIKSKLN